MILFVFLFRLYNMHKCILSTSILDKIMSNHEATDIVRHFHDIHEKLSAYDLVNVRRLFRSAAVEHNHTELSVLLLSNTHYDDDKCSLPNTQRCCGEESSSSHLYTGRPLLCRHLIHCDCFSDYSDIIKLLVSYNMEDNQDGYDQ